MEQQRDCDFSVIGHYPTGYAIFERRLLSSKLADLAIENPAVLSELPGFRLLKMPCRVSRPQGARPSGKVARPLFERTFSQAYAPSRPAMPPDLK